MSEQDPSTYQLQILKQDNATQEDVYQQGIVNRSMHFLKSAGAVLLAAGTLAVATDTASARQANLGRNTKSGQLDRNTKSAQLNFSIQSLEYDLYKEMGQNVLLGGLDSAVTSAATFEAPAFANSQQNTTPKAQVANLRPLTPVQLYDRTQYFMGNGKTGNLSGLEIVTLGTSYKGDVAGDVTKWILAKYTNLISGPCGQPGGNELFYSLSNRKGTVGRRCADTTSDGKAQVGVNSQKQLCTFYIKDQGWDITYKECEAVDLQSTLDYAGTIAAKSVGINPNSYGETSKVEELGFNKQAIIDYKRVPNSNERTLKQLVITMDGNIPHDRKFWY